jgi:hypothetical protein
MKGIWATVASENKMIPVYLRCNPKEEMGKLNLPKKMAVNQDLLKSLAIAEVSKKLDIRSWECLQFETKFTRGHDDGIAVTYEMVDSVDIFDTNNEIQYCRSLKKMLNRLR